MEVIGIGGQAGSGKDTVADHLKERLNELGWTGGWKRASFAAAVKKCFCEYFDVDHDFIEGWKRRQDIPPGMLKPVRQAMQFIGDGFRQIKADIWVDLCFRLNEPPIIISDARYFNESAEVHKRGGINILMWRPGHENDDPNPSESQIKPLVDYLVKAGAPSGPVGQYLANVEDPRWRAYDLFVRNDRGVEGLYRTADEVIVPYIERHFAQQG
jgi:hypothetical protein